MKQISVVSGSVFDRVQRRDSRASGLYHDQRSRRIANAYIKRLRRFCEGFAMAPHRGEMRTDVKEGQRTIGFEHRISIVFRVYDDQQLVRITGIRYAGRSFEKT